jgi:hypothetical protein
VRSIRFIALASPGGSGRQSKQCPPSRRASILLDAICALIPDSENPLRPAACLIIISRGSVVDFGGYTLRLAQLRLALGQARVHQEQHRHNRSISAGMSSGELKSDGGSAAPTKISFIALKPNTCGRVAHLSITSS